MTARLPQDLADRVLASHPLPIADATAALVAADGPFEQRDRVVEVFRAVNRYLAALALAARVQFGPGPSGDSLEVKNLLRALRGRGLTDGQWFGLVRELLKPYEKNEAAYPLPDLVKLVYARKSEFGKLIDELLLMRKAETVAHGATGTKAALADILARRVPQLARLLELLDPLWQKARLVATLPFGEGEGEAEGERAQQGLLLMGDTPPRGRFRRIELAPGVRLPPHSCVLTDADGKPILALHPLVLARPPTPEAPSEFFTLDGGTKKGAVYVAIPSMAEHRDAEAWKLLEKSLAGEEPEGPEGDGKGPSRPYRGLSSFGPEDSALFFGREAQSEALANRVRRNGFVTVTGPSGSGKSSLLGAGVLPLLSDWKRVWVRPGAHPLESLAQKLAPALKDFVTHDDLLARIRSAPKELGALLLGFERGEKGEGQSARFVLVVDQAEEMLTLCEDEKERIAFAQALASLGSDADGPCRVVLSVREDFFGRLATLAPLRGLYSREVEVVTTPDRDALARAVYAPAKAFGYAFEEEDLVWTMVDAVAGEPAALALVSFCCDKLWETRDRSWKRLGWEAYRALGGVEGALAAHADKVLEALGPAERRVCRGIFMRLVTGEKTRAVVSRMELADALGGEASVNPVLERLVQARLVTVSDAERPGEARVEIVHEALIRHWRALAAWLEEDVEGQRLAHALRQAAREWEGRHRPKGLLWSGDVLEEYRLWQRGKRIRRALVASALVITSAFGVFMLFQWRAAVAARSRAEIRGLIASSRLEEPSGRPDKALVLLRAAADASRSANVSAEGASDGFSDGDIAVDLSRLSRSGSASLVLPGHEGPVLRVAASPDGQTLVTGSVDGTIRRWNLATGKTLSSFAVDGHVINAVVYSPDGGTIAAASGDTRQKVGGLWLFDAKSGEVRASIRAHEDVASIVQFSRDGSLVATGSVDGTARVWDSTTGDVVASFSHDGPVLDIAFSPDGAEVAVAASRTVTTWLIGTGEQRATFSRPKTVRSVMYSPDGRWLAIAGVDPEVRLHDVSMPESSRVFSGHEDTVRDVAFSSDGHLLATASTDKTVRLWDLQKGGLPRILRHPAPISQVGFFPDDSRLAAASGPTVHVWDVETGILATELRGHEDVVQNFTILPGGARLVTGSADRTARIWDPSSAPLLSARRGPAPAAVEASSKGGFRRAKVTPDGSLELTIVSKASRTITLRPSGKPITELAFSPNDELLVSGAEDGAVSVWDVRTREARGGLPAHGDRVTSIAFSPDGALFATGSWDRSARVWSVSTNAPAHALEGHEGRVTSVVFSHDGKLLATASSHTARLWDVATGKELKMLAGHEQRVSAVAFSPDDKLLATGSADGRVRLFDVDSGKLIHLSSGHGNAITALGFSENGKELASASADGAARAWDVATGKILAVFPEQESALVSISYSPESEIHATAADGLVLSFRASSPWESAGGPLAFTNLRVCPGSFAVVPVVPFPKADTVWAPEGACLGRAGR